MLSIKKFLQSFEISQSSIRRFLFLVFILTLMLGPLKQHVWATDVSGPITTNTTWSKANSPYIITCNVLVMEGVTLTIESGVIVKFQSGTALQIDSESIAIGVESDSIVFTSNQAIPTPVDSII